MRSQDKWLPGFAKRAETVHGEEFASIQKDRERPMITEGTHGTEYAYVGARMDSSEGVHETGWAHIDKYDDDMTAYAANKLGILVPQKHDFDALNIQPYEQLTVEGNGITTEGLGRLTNFLIGTGSLVGFTATTTRLGVGDGSTAFAAADVDLSASSGSTHRWFQVVDSAPTRVTTTVTNDSIQAVATFATGDGNFAWNEWGLNLGTATVSSSAVVDASAGKTFFNRKVASLGTKVSGSWALTVKVVFS